MNNIILYVFILYCINAHYLRGENHNMINYNHADKINIIKLTNYQEEIDTLKMSSNTTTEKIYIPGICLFLFELGLLLFFLIDVYIK